MQRLKFYALIGALTVASSALGQGINPTISENSSPVKVPLQWEVGADVRTLSMWNWGSLDKNLRFQLSAGKGKTWFRVWGQRHADFFRWPSDEYSPGFGQSVYLPGDSLEVLTTDIRGESALRIGAGTERRYNGDFWFLAVGLDLVYTYTKHRGYFRQRVNRIVDYGGGLVAIWQTEEHESRAISYTNQFGLSPRLGMGLRLVPKVWISAYGTFSLVETHGRTPSLWGRRTEFSYTEESQLEVVGELWHQELTLAYRF